MHERQRQLRALGIEPLVRRGPDAGSHQEAAEVPEASALAAPVPRLRLWFAEGRAPQEAGLQRLLRDVLNALGLTPEQAEGHDSNLPQLAFGDRAPEGAVVVTSLTRLRDPLEKRIAWPILRRLRQRLRTDGA